MRRTAYGPLIAGILCAAVLISGCTSGAQTPSTAAASSSSPPSGSARSIAVQLIEGKVTPTPATAAAGAVTFSIKNIGMAVHDFLVIDTDLKADALPMSGQVVDKSRLTVVGAVKNIALRATPTLQVDLAPGHYALICNIEDHYAAGMHADFDVTE